MSNRPKPLADQLTKFYWEGTKHEQLLIQRCDLCGHWNQPAKERCPKCGSCELTPQPVPLKGEVYSHCMTHQSRISGFENKVPFMVVIVKLEGIPVKIVCNMIDCQHEDVHIGMPVKIVFEHLEEVSLPQATPQETR